MEQATETPNTTDTTERGSLRSSSTTGYATGTPVRIKDTCSEMHRPNTAKILSGPDGSGFYWIEMSTGVQWRCPGYRIIVA